MALAAKSTTRRRVENCLYLKIWILRIFGNAFWTFKRTFWAAHALTPSNSDFAFQHWQFTRIISFFLNGDGTLWDASTPKDAIEGEFFIYKSRDSGFWGQNYMTKHR